MLKQESTMSNQEKPALMERVEQLIQEFSGREWKKISGRLLEEGYGDLGTNFLRKKFARWESKRGEQLLQEPETVQPEGVAAMVELISKRIFEQPIPEEWISQIEDHVEDMMKPVMIRIAQAASMEAVQSISASRSESEGLLEEPPE